MKIGIISSSGGHLTEVRTLAPEYAAYDHFYVLNKQVILPEDMRGKTYFIAHSERDWRSLLNLWEGYIILRKERPDMLISTGAGLIVPLALIARLFRIRVVFIETMTRIEAPSLTGKIMYYLANDFIYQWPQLGRHFPKGTYGGLLL